MKKRRRAEQIVGLLRQADVDLGKGVNVPNVCRRLGISPLRPLPLARPALMRAGVPKPTKKLVRSSIQGGFPRERGGRSVFAKLTRSHPPKVEVNGFGMGVGLCPHPKSSKTTRPGVIRTHDQGIMSGDEPEE